MKPAASRQEELENFRRLAEVVHETKLTETILKYARSGHASPAMIEAAIEIQNKQIDFFKRVEENNLLKDAESLKNELEKALIAGVDSLRRKRGPGPEAIEVEEPLAADRIAKGHQIRRQVRCANGIIDIYDLTADEIIECKLRGTNNNLGEAAGQLRRYSKSFPGTSLSIAVLKLEDDAYWLADVIRQQGITIIETKPQS